MRDVGRRSVVMLIGVDPLTEPMPLVAEERYCLRSIRLAHGACRDTTSAPLIPIVLLPAELIAVPAPDRTTPELPVMATIPFELIAP